MAGQGGFGQNRGEGIEQPFASAKFVFAQLILGV